MAKTLQCEIVTPERILYTNEVEFVVAPTTGGEVGILPLHAPLVATLEPGEVRVRTGAGDHDWEWFAVSGGYLQVHEDKVIVLAADARSVSQIDAERVRQAAERARDRLAALRADGSEAAEVEAATLENDLRWYEAQVELASRRRP
jgi:F-type H+-transporting ATPase subunit epsilon